MENHFRLINTSVNWFDCLIYGCTLPALQDAAAVEIDN